MLYKHKTYQYWASVRDKHRGTFYEMRGHVPESHGSRDAKAYQWLLQHCKKREVILLRHQLKPVLTVNDDKTVADVVNLPVKRESTLPRQASLPHKPAPEVVSWLDNVGKPIDIQGDMTNGA